MPQTLRKGVAEKGDREGHVDTRPSLAERIGQARKERAGHGARRDEAAIERARRKPFEESPLLKAHADELLAVTGELARVLPSVNEYRVRVDGGWPEGSMSSHAVIENPACTFVWEVKHGKQGLLANSSNREYNWALGTTDAISALWEDEPCATEAQLAKALIAHVVLQDDELRAVVLERAAALARTTAGTLGPYFAEWKH